MLRSMRHIFVSGGLFLTEIPIFEENKIKETVMNRKFWSSLIASVEYACMGTTSES